MGAPTSAAVALRAGARPFFGCLLPDTVLETRSLRVNRACLPAAFARWHQRLRAVADQVVASAQAQSFAYKLKVSWTFKLQQCALHSLLMRGLGTYMGDWVLGSRPV